MTCAYDVYQHLKRLGAPANLRGYEFMHRAVVKVLGSREYLGAITKALYPEIAAEFGARASQVERDMRHLVDYIFDNTDVDVLYDYFGNTINKKTGKLTNSQFIAGLANYIKMEVNHD